MQIKDLHLGLFLISLVFPKPLYCQAMICEIKYGVKSLDQNALRANLYRKLRNKPLITCNQIGVEHDSNLSPIKNRPIYACCSPMKVTDPSFVGSGSKVKNKESLT